MKIAIPGEIQWVLPIGTVLLGLACDNSTAPAAHYSRAAAAAFAVRSGATINPTGIPGVFDTGSDEAFLEFPIDFPTSSPVVVNVTIADLVIGVTEPPTGFRVALYGADGLANVSDYGGGTPWAVAAHPSTIAQSRATFSFDVTAGVDSLRTAGATHVGVRFYRTSQGQLSVDMGAMLEAGP